MSKILYLNEISAAAREAGVPGVDDLMSSIEEQGQRLAEALAEHLGIEAGVFHDDIDGVGCSFYPSIPDQPCPQVIDEADEEGDWETMPPRVREMKKEGAGCLL